MPRFITAQEAIQLLDDANIRNAVGKIEISFDNFSVQLKQRDTVGNALQEWFSAFLTSKDIYYRPNIGQTFPDFYFSEEDTVSLCEMKSFYGSANFDVANYRSYISSIAEKPYRLNSDYIIFKYNMDKESGEIRIEDYWCKKVWEITGSATDYILKCQRKKGQIYNIRPVQWFSNNTAFPAFGSLERMLNALYKTELSESNNARETNAWLSKVVEGYNEFFGTDISVAQIKSL